MLLNVCHTVATYFHLYNIIIFVIIKYLHIAIDYICIMHTETSCKYLLHDNVSGSKFVYTCCTDVIQLFLRLYASKYCSTYISTVGVKQHVSMLQCCIVYHIWVYQNIAKCDWILVKYILYRNVVNKNILRNQTRAGLSPGLK